MQHLNTKYSKKISSSIWQNIGKVLVALLLLSAGTEIVARFILHRSIPKEIPVGTPLISGSETYDWFAQLQTERKELAQQFFSYAPYVLWRYRTFSGKTINIDANGNRFTTGSKCGKSSVRIFAFGGSNLWGAYVPDWETVPSYLQKRFRKAGRDVCIINFGQAGYVTTQSLIDLMRQLQDNHLPRIVLFLGGGNDVDAAYVSREAGVHDNYQIIASKLQNKPRLVAHWHRLFPNLALLLDSSALVTQNDIEKKQNSDLLSKKIVATYLQNIQMVLALGKHFNFSSHFYWEPALPSSRKQLTAEERTFLASIPAVQAQLHRQVYDDIKKEKRHHSLTLLTPIFDSTAERMWMDTNHFTPYANRRVGELIFDSLSTKSQISHP
ncbi:MAG: SGNH/GDSL hydrolase family protein [Deltaproteobacteria bacterium]|nr:SGNH/GDSL hydrolase family protein [Deltaproteobacteria bacterium]